MEKYYAGCGGLSQARLAELERRQTVASACELPLLPIRPLVKAKDQVFHIKYQPISDFLKEQKINNYLLVTAPGAYLATLDQLEGTNYTCIYVTDTKEDTLCAIQTLYDGTVAHQQKDASLPKHLVQQTASLADRTFEAVVALGGGVASDAGKYFAENIIHAPLYSVPTALSVNASFCYKAAIRMKDPYKSGAYNVVYKFYGLPQAICIDLDVITGSKLLQRAQAGGEDSATAGRQWNMLRELNIAGAGDLLSILTATFDWRINSLVARGMSVPDPIDHRETTILEKPFSQDVSEGAKELLSLLAEHADDIRNGRKAGAMFLARAYHWIAEQSWIMQHTMWESASEHGMFDHFENVAGTELTHGQVVALSVYFMSLLQENEHERALSMIQRLGLDISLADLAINPRTNYKIAPITLYDCLADLKAYIDEIAYRYTIISAKPITKDWVLTALDKYYTDIYGTLEEQCQIPASGADAQVCAGEKARLDKIIQRVRAGRADHQAAMEQAAKAEQAARTVRKAELDLPELTTQRYMALCQEICQAKADAYADYLRNRHQVELAAQYDSCQ